MIEAIFFDIDGTLLSLKTHQMTEALEEALKKLRANNIKLFLATGRHVTEMHEMKKYPYFDGAITLNGCYCLNEKEAYYKHHLTKEDSQLAIEIASQMKYPMALIDEHTMSVNFLNDYVIKSANYADVPIPRVQDPKAHLGKEIYQVVLYVAESDDSVILKDMKNIDYARWHPNFVDVIPKNASKRQGIIETCRYYGLDLSNCMAFGDGGNDIPMLEVVGHGVAMGNASEDVKAIAKETTLSVDEDGIIHTLKKYHLL